MYTRISADEVIYLYFFFRKSPVKTKRTNVSASNVPSMKKLPLDSADKYVVSFFILNPINSFIMSESIGQGHAAMA